MLILYDSSGRPAYPLDVPAESFYIKHEYGGNETLEFDISPRHELYPFLAEEIQVGWDDNIYLVKAINERAEISTITCELDFDKLKETAYRTYTSTTRTLRDVLQEQLPGWTLDGVDLVSIRRTIELEACSGYDVVMQAMETYGIVYEWHMANRTVRILKPENEQPSGQFLSEELNLKSIVFKGNSKEFITRLYPYGKDGMTIESVNDGKTYLENHDYSNKIISGIWEDDRYTDPQNLKDDAIERLKKLAWPVRSYECEVTDLAKQLPDYDFMDFKLYKIVTLLDKVRKTRVDHRIVEYQEYPYAPHLNVVTLSSVAEKITTKIDKIEVKFNDEVKVDREKINEIRRDVDTNSARIAETYTKGETDTRIESLVQQSADSITTTVRQEISTAVDGIQVGGRNLLLKSGVPATTAAYHVNSYYFGSTKPVSGETYTLSLKGTLHGEKTSFNVYNSGGTVRLCILTREYLDKDGVYRATFSWKITQGNVTVDNSHIQIYAIPESVTGVESTIEWIKLEKGNKATDWTPAPEDVQTEITETKSALETQINQTAEQIQLEAEKTYTTKKDLSEDVQKLQASINANAAAITNTVSSEQYNKDWDSGVSGNKLSSILQQTAQNYTLYFSQMAAGLLDDAAETAQKIVDGAIEGVATFFEFTANGLTIGKSDSPFKAQFDNARLAFLQNGQAITWISNSIFHALGIESEGPLTMTNSKVAGKWVMDADATGRLNIYWRN